MSDWSIAPEVTTVNNGIESLLQLGRALPDLLITDLNMPQTDGFQVLHAIRAMPEFDSLEIVVVTGIGQEEISARGGLPPSSSRAPTSALPEARSVPQYQQRTSWPRR